MTASRSATTTKRFFTPARAFTLPIPILLLVCGLFLPAAGLASTQNGGMLVYGDRTSADDQIKYKLFNSSGQQNWSTAGNAADVDAGSTDKVPVAILLYSASSRNEKVMLTNHWVNATQITYLYAQVWNGNTQSWGNVKSLTSFNSGTLLGGNQWRRFMSGAYLANGDFMAVFTDASTQSPVYHVWDGSSWSASASSCSATAVGGLIQPVRAAARPGTNEVMVAAVTENLAVRTFYYNGGGYSTANWVLHSTHSADGRAVNKENGGIVWSRHNPTRCALAYSDSGSLQPHFNIFTADGSGGGSWGTEDNNGPSTGDEPMPLLVVDRPGADEFLIACSDETSTSPDINILEERDGDTTPTLQALTNGEVTTAAEPNSATWAFGLAYERQDNGRAVIVYGDTTTVPKLKKYDPATDTWDASETSLSDVTGNVETVDVIPDPRSKDMIVLIRTGDSPAADRDLHTVFWDGENDAVYATGNRAMTEHATSNGYFSTNHAAYFAWDEHKRDKFFNLFE